MTRRATGAALIRLLAGGSATAQDVPGKVIFEHNCGPCHAAGLGHAGTMRLAQSRGTAKAVLEQRTDLDAGYIRFVVRHGLIEMPPWRPSELDDAALEQLVQYLAAGKRHK
jgi:mono/diheme cytochrome c family protein